jgi:hypothetical protein
MEWHNFWKKLVQKKQEHMIQCIAIIKSKTTNILCLCSFIVCVCVVGRNKQETKHNKNEGKNKIKCQPNPFT